MKKEFPGRHKKVRVLVNPKSGVGRSFDGIRRSLSRHWESAGHELTYQFCLSVEDGMKKARIAVEDGIDIVLVAGGDGTVNTIGRTLIGTNTALGIIPTGSGNGFARHFEIPLGVEEAVRSLLTDKTILVDVGLVNGTPFLVTCSMAWDASIVESFEKSLFRGVLPYIFAGVNEYFQYEPQDMEIEIDGEETISLKEVVVFTVANLSQYGGGAVIAPHARADDGYLELVVAVKKDMPWLIANLPRLFDGTIHKMPQLITRRFRRLKVVRGRPASIQVDGELQDGPCELSVSVNTSALKVLVPR